MSCCPRSARAILFLAALLPWSRERSAASESIPRLVVLVSVDQLPARYLTEFRELFAADGFFARVDQRGAWFDNCHHRHAFTITGPGHSVMMTGTDPARTGIVGNSWFDRRGGASVSCVEDGRYKIVGSASADKGVSPHNLLAPTLGDTLKQATAGKAKVFGVSWKDRSGVLMAGHAADACYWFDEGSGNWVTSTYYRDDLPGYLRNFNESSGAARFAGKAWELLLPKEKYRYFVPDDNRFETNIPFFGRSFPHQLPKAARGPYFTLVGLTPFGNELTLAVSALVIEHENLGQDETPDILCIGLSANDYVGHAFGPHSLEVQDITARTDRQLGGFVDFVDSKLNGAPWLLVLSSDHGVAPIPELAASFKLPAARNPLGSLDALEAKLESRLRAELGPPGEDRHYIQKIEPGEVYLRQEIPELYGQRFSEAQRVVQKALVELPSVAAAHTRDELMGGGSGSRLLGQLRRSFNEGRSGDVLFALTPYSIQGSRNAATHGSPWSYDTHVPLLWLGAGVRRGRYAASVSPAHIGPTVSRVLGQEVPAGSVVEPLIEVVLSP
jgi:hypothetical protein